VRRPGRSDDPPLGQDVEALALFGPGPGHRAAVDLVEGVGLLDPDLERQVGGGAGEGRLGRLLRRAGRGRLGQRVGKGGGPRRLGRGALRRAMRSSNPLKASRAQCSGRKGLSAFFWASSSQRPAMKVVTAPSSNVPTSLALVWTRSASTPGIRSMKAPMLSEAQVLRQVVSAMTAIGTTRPIAWVAAIIGRGQRGIARAQRRIATWASAPASAVSATPP
jgi:hypothetical protein